MDGWNGLISTGRTAEADGVGTGATARNPSI